MEDDLEQQVAEFLEQVFPVARADGLGDLVGLLDGVGGDGGEALFPIPRAAGLRVETGIFQTDMQGAAGNAGPGTSRLDSTKLF